ncbi:MAG TPA: hypothetical protein VHW45_18400, partial [Candidatus Sulfotelmatobacter sp.]|nr:hypothetical protein [Candidatus Sulfotelmatobacter sp.]
SCTLDALDQNWIKYSPQEHTRRMKVSLGAVDRYDPMLGSFPSALLRSVPAGTFRRLSKSPQLVRCVDLDQARVPVATAFP